MKYGCVIGELDAKSFERGAHCCEFALHRARYTEASWVSGARGVAELVSLMGFAGCFEIIGGALLAVGYQTRFVAFILSGEMAVGYFVVHAPHSFYPILNNGDAAILFCFIFLLFVFTGAGMWSVDAIAGGVLKQSGK